MAGDERQYIVFLSAAEPSGDAHCAALARALFSMDSVRLIGVGGPKMAAAGVELLELTTERAAMTYNAFSQVLYFHGLLKKIKNCIRENNVDLAVVCDSPAFNFHVARGAKSLGVKTLFYVAPQLWAWAPWRIRKLKKYCDKLCCILPFEQEWFSSRGIDTEFVGSPLLEQINSEPTKKYYLGFEPDRAHTAIMPGSRSAEINSLWPAMQHTAAGLQIKYPHMKFTVVALNEKVLQHLQYTQLPELSCEYVIESVYDTARAADFAIVASGSATLQVAAAGCPMVIMYQSSKLLWELVGRWLVTTKYLSLVNIIAQNELVPEFMPYFDSIVPVEEKIEELLNQKELLVHTSSELVELVRPLVNKQPSRRVAQIVNEMLNKQKPR
jgi:lipid-A-disaccharide synthase